MSKEVVEEVSGWFRVFTDGTVDRKWSGKDEQVAPLTMPVPPSNDTFVDGVATKDVVVNEETGVWVRIYLPQTALHGDENQRLGVVIHLHGGGFCISHADWQMYYQFYSRLVRTESNMRPAEQHSMLLCGSYRTVGSYLLHIGRVGALSSMLLSGSHIAFQVRTSNVICVSADVRLAPEHRLPAACEDSFGVLLSCGEREESWLTRYADFGRCVLMGDSSGGNLVHQLGLRALATPRDLLQPLSVRGGVSIHPGYVRSERSKSEMEMSDSAFFTLDMVDKFLKLSAPEGFTTRDHPITNPMGPYAPPLKDSKFPRMLVAIADRDLMRDTQLEYCEAMKIAGHELEIFISANVPHSFYLNEIAVKADPHIAREASNLLQAIDCFVKSCF